jgi:hypothetical protein
MGVLAARSLTKLFSCHVCSFFFFSPFLSSSFASPESPLIIFLLFLFKFLSYFYNFITLSFISFFHSLPRVTECMDLRSMPGARCRLRHHDSILRTYLFTLYHCCHGRYQRHWKSQLVHLQPDFSPTPPLTSPGFPLSQFFWHQCML